MRDSVRRRRQPAKEVQVEIVERASCKRGFQKKRLLGFYVVVTIACLIYYFRLTDPPLALGQLAIIFILTMTYNMAGLQQVFQKKGRFAVTATLACLIFYFRLFDPPLCLDKLTDEERAELKLAEPALIANLTANSPYQLDRFCGSDGECFIVEQRYWMMHGGLRAARLITHELFAEVPLTISYLKTPEIITAHHLVHEQWAIDPSMSYLSYLIQVAAGFMLEGLSFGSSLAGSASLQPVQLQQRVLQIGLGGGTTTRNLRKLPIQLHLDIVEPEPAVYEAAKRWFAFPDASPNINVHIMNGAVFLKEAAESGLTFDSVILDAPAYSPTASIVCPHPVFVEDDVMDAMSKVLSSHGVLSVNVFLLEARREEEVIRKFSAHFRSCSAPKIHDNGQKLLVCSNRAGFTWADHRTRMLDNLKRFDDIMGTEIASHVDHLNP